MSYEPPTLEVYLNKIAVKTFARSYYKKLIKSFNLKGDERIMDYGSGPGGPASFIAKKLNKGKGWLTCVDISQKWINCVKKVLSRYNNVDYKLGHIYQLDIPNDSYDLILIHFVLHEIPTESRKKVVASLVEKLKDGGLVIMREPMADSKTEENMMKLFEKEGLKKVSQRDVKVPLSGRTVEVKFKK